MNLVGPASAFAVCFLAVGSVVAQQSVSPSLSSAPPAPQVLSAASSSSCNPWRYLPPAGDLSFAQRACFQAASLTQPLTILRGAALAGLSEWRDSGKSSNNHTGFSRHFGDYYARKSAKSAGELIAGYLNHEDPRPQLSLEHGTWNRIRSALLGVIRVKNADGDSRPAFVPLAGAFSSGMVDMAVSPNRNSLGSGFERAGMTYSTYFATALAREFKPDLTLLAGRILHKKR